MEYIYAAMLLHTTGEEINEENVKKVLEAAGAEADDARIKALIAALEDVDIEEAMEKTAVATSAATSSSAPEAEESKEEEEEEEEDEEEQEEEAAAGLGALFG